MAKKQAKATPKAVTKPSKARPPAKAVKKSPPKPSPKPKSPPKPSKPQPKPAPKAATKQLPPSKAVTKQPPPSKAPKPPAPKAQPRPAAKPAAPKAQPQPTVETKARPSAAASAPTSPQPSPGLSKSTPTPSVASLTNGIRYLTVEELVELHIAVDREIGGRNASPGVVESQFGLVRAVQIPQSTYLGREAYQAFSDKAAVLYWGLLRDRPFKDGNRRVALVSLLVFCELNGATIDGKVLDERKLEVMTKKAWSHKEDGVAPETMFGEVRNALRLAIKRGR